MIRTKALVALGLATGLAFVPLPAAAKDKVKVGFIGPLTGGTSANGLGGRNSADLAVKLRNADPKAKYEYELVVLDDECKPNVARAGGDQGGRRPRDRSPRSRTIARSRRSPTVDTYNKFGLPIVVWGAVLPDITYRNKYPEVHRVNGTMINQNEVAAELMTEPRLQDAGSVIHDTTDYGKGHNQYFCKYLKAERRRDRSAPSASPPTSRISPPSSPRPSRSIPRSSISAG